jgi:hypothetical protein
MLEYNSVRPSTTSGIGETLSALIGIDRVFLRTVEAEWLLGIEDDLNGRCGDN